MDKRVRSPNYPAFGLPEAITKVELLYKSQHTHAAPREVAAKGMGYNSLNGASATAISALNKYGLVEKAGDGVRVSERALRIMHPHSPDERREALREAAMDPPLFAELHEKFPPPIPSEELLRNYLLRNGFAPGAVSPVILAYRDTMDLVDREATDYAAATRRVEVSTPMPMEMRSGPTGASAGTMLIHQGPERSLGRYDFEGGGFVRIAVGGEIPTEAALAMAETLIKMKREEIGRRTATPPVTGEAPRDNGGNNEIPT